jgi:Lon protease-like protein
MAREQTEDDVGWTRLPLFPLQVVLFPASRLPLHIFEDRYKVLVNQCIRDDREFGIVLADGGEVAAVGCTARIVAVLKVYDDGQLDIVVEGCRRFRVHRFDEKRAPYTVGEVEFFGPAAEHVDGSLVDETIRLYNELVTLVYKEKVETIDRRAVPEELSFVIVQKAGMDVTRRQQVLETPSETERLKLLRDYLQEIVPKLEKAGEIERIVRGDGYLPRIQSPEDE